MTETVATPEQAPEAPAEKAEKKKSVKKEAKPTVKRKLIAVAHGTSLRMSKKHGIFISRFIKGKDIDTAIADLKQVMLLKKAVPFTGEIPHRKGKGMMSGRYPVSAAEQFIPLLKGLKGNAIVNGLDVTHTRIYFASANWAPRPARRGGKHAKRTHITVKAKEMTSGKK